MFQLVVMYLAGCISMKTFLVNFLKVLNGVTFFYSVFTVSYHSYLYRSFYPSKVHMSRQRGAVVWSVVFTAAMIARLMVLLLPMARNNCVLGLDASR